MRCIGRTKKLIRCQNNASLLFCKTHRFQPYLLAFAITGGLGISLFWDVIVPTGRWLTSLVWDEATVQTQARIDFYNIEVTDFGYFEGAMPGGGWPRKLDLQNAIFFGIHPSVWLRVYNGSDHPITVRYFSGCLSVDSRSTEWETFHRYYTSDFSTTSAFPLYLGARQEVILILPITWPVSGRLKSSLPELENDTLYSAPFIVSGYLSKVGKGMFGSPGGFEDVLRTLLTNDFREIWDTDTSAIIEVTMVGTLASGEQFTQRVTVPK